MINYLNCKGSNIDLCDIILSGIDIQPKHCIIYNKHNTIWIEAIGNSVVFLNGEIIMSKTAMNGLIIHNNNVDNIVGRVLNHNSRVCFGRHHIFRFEINSNATNSNKVGWEYAYEELLSKNDVIFKQPNNINIDISILKSIHNFDNKTKSNNEINENDLDIKNNTNEYQILKQHYNHNKTISFSNINNTEDKININNKPKFRYTTSLASPKLKNENTDNNNSFHSDNLKNMNNINNELIISNNNLKKSFEKEAKELQLELLDMQKLLNDRINNNF